MKAKNLLLMISLLALFGGCTKKEQYISHENSKELPVEIHSDDSGMLVNEKLSTADSLDSIYTKYVMMYGGEVRGDYALVGSAELLLHLNELPFTIKEKIEYISIDTPIEDVPMIDGLENLKEVQFHAVGLKHVENLENLKVDILSLTINPLESIYSIGKNPYIKKLDLTSSQVRMLPDMSGMKNLRELVLLRTDITTLENIQTIPGPVDLNILECDYLVDIESLRLAKIGKLYISKDGVNSIGGKHNKPGLYDRYKDWFDSQLLQLKTNNPEFELLFFMKEG